MNVRTTRLGVATYLAPDFPLTHEHLETFTLAVEESASSPNTHLVLDLERVAVLDSAALEKLLDLASQLRESAGSIRITGANEICRDILRITDMQEKIPVFDDRESVGRSFL
jgi:anti-anti-sigma factor